MQVTSAEIARRLGVSQRHARRMIDAGDSRLEPVDRACVLERSRERIALKCDREADAIAIAAIRLTESEGEAHEGPELARLAALAKRLRRVVSDLRVLAVELNRAET